MAVVRRGSARATRLRSLRSGFRFPWGRLPGLVDLDEIARWIGDERLAARSDRLGIAHLHAAAPQLCDRAVEVVDQQGEMLAVPGRGCALDQVHLLSAGVQPRPTEPEVRPVG